MNDGPWRVIAVCESQQQVAGEDMGRFGLAGSTTKAPAQHRSLLGRIGALAEQLAALRRKRPVPTHVRPVRPPGSLKPRLHF